MYKNKVEQARKKKRKKREGKCPFNIIRVGPVDGDGARSTGA